MSIETKLLNDATQEINAKGKLDKDDYQEFIPEVENMLKSQNKLNLLVHVDAFQGWTPAAAWEDFKFDVRHYRDISRLALVGNEQSQEWMKTASKPFTAADVRFSIYSKSKGGA